MNRSVVFAKRGMGASTTGFGQDSTRRRAADPGPLAVDVVRVSLPRTVDSKTNLSCKVSFPTTGGPYPVIVFSHGFGANQNAFASASRHWASHGYVVICPSHDDGLGRGGVESESDVGPGRGRLNLGGLRASIQDPGRISGRVTDIVLVLDALEKLPEMNPGLRGRIDKSRVGVGGHSFGAYTAMLVGGVAVDLGGQKAKSFRDKRVRCILPISAQGTGQQGLTKGSWKDLAIPMMTISGTMDRGSGGQTAQWKTEAYRFSPPGDKFLVVIDGANHFSFGGGLGRRSDGIVELVNAISVAFWDAYLKDSRPAKESLSPEKASLEFGKAVRFEGK
jgi:predicted dienelactone hydrolase